MLHRLGVGAANEALQHRHKQGRKSTGAHEHLRDICLSTCVFGGGGGGMPMGLGAANETLQQEIDSRRGAGAAETVCL